MGGKKGRKYRQEVGEGREGRDLEGKKELGGVEGRFSKEGRGERQRVESIWVCRKYNTNTMLLCHPFGSPEGY